LLHILTVAIGDRRQPRALKRRYHFRAIDPNYQGHFHAPINSRKKINRITFVGNFGVLFGSSLNSIWYSLRYHSLGVFIRSFLQDGIRQHCAFVRRAFLSPAPTLAWC
jgi:hypothetical protein